MSHRILNAAAAQTNINPTEGQKAAGNYKKGRVIAHGLPIAIENPRGSVRRGVDANGKPWACKLPCHYGEISRTVGADQDPIDVFIGPHLKSPKVFVLDQHDAETGKFDEAKVFFGFNSTLHVQNTYRKSFSDGKADRRFGHLTQMTVPQFKDWLRDGDTKNPLKRAAGGRIPHMAEGGALMSDEDMGMGSGTPAAKMMSDADMGIKEEPTTTWGSFGKQLALGVPRGVLEMAGMGQDTMTLKPLRDTARGLAAFVSAPEGEGAKAFVKAHQSEPGWGHTMREGVGLEGENAPKTGLERIASGIGEGAASGPAGPAGSVGKVLTNIAIGGLSGGTGRAVAEAVPENWKPLAEMAGNVVAGGAAGVATAGPAAGRAAVSRAIEPLTTEGQRTIAGRVLESRATDADALRASLEDTAGHEIVPGSRPTTFQATGDMGIGSLEREVATQNPAEFMERRGQQNAARVETLDNLQPTGNPQEVATAVRSHIADVESMTQRAVDDALVEAQTRARELGGTQNQEAYGNTMRTALNDAETTARTQERALWNAVDPEGDLTMNMAPVQQSAQRVYGDLSQAANASLKPIEHQVLDVIGQYGPIESFRELTDLRSLVSGVMREELVSNGRTPAYGRLSQLRGGIEQSINGAVADRAVADAANVAAGRIAPEQSLASNIQRQVAEWQAERASGQRAAVGDGETTASGPGALSPASGEPRAPELRPSNDAGNTGVSDGPPVAANFDQAAAQRLREASAATRERAQTFGAQPLKGITQREGTGGPYRMRESAVPSKIFHPGDSGFEDVSRYRAAVGDEHALPVLRDYAASSLRESALTPEGVIDPAKFTRWQTQHAEAMRAFPELGQQFETAAQATRAMGDAAALQRTARDAAREGALGKVMHLTDPQDITRAVGSIFGGPGSVAEMRRLVAQTRGNPAAVEGLRKTVADYVTQKFMSNTEAATSGRTLIKSDQFQTFVKNNEAALAQVFTPEEMASLRAISADLQRANRSVTAVKLPGQSNTAQDVSGVLRNNTGGGAGQSWLGKLMVDGAAGLGGWLASSNPAVAMASAGIAHVANAIRGAGFKKVDDLVKQAMLDPALARALLAKVPAKTAPAADRMLARRITAITAANIAREREREKKTGE